MTEFTLKGITYCSVPTKAGNCHGCVWHNPNSMRLSMCDRINCVTPEALEELKSIQKSGSDLHCSRMVRQDGQEVIWKIKSEEVKP